MNGAPRGKVTVRAGSTISRRLLLRRGALSAAALGAIGVVGCSSSNNNKPAASSANAAAPGGATTPTASAAAAGTANAGSVRSTLATAAPEPAGLKRGGRIQWPTADPGGNMDPYRDA